MFIYSHGVYANLNGYYVLATVDKVKGALFSIKFIAVAGNSTRASNEIRSSMRLGLTMYAIRVFPNYVNLNILCISPKGT